MKNIAMRLSYDGTNYHGWQYQKNGISVQQVLEDNLSELTNESIKVTGCSRTDAGVHALDYVMNFMSNTNIPPEKLPYALNYRLNGDICAIDAWYASDDFNARFSAKGKTYVYNIMNSKFRNPFMKRYSWYMPFDLDFESMKSAAKYFVGEHDFSAFMAVGGSQKTTVRTVNFCELEKKENLIRLTIDANAYLYNMVRIITGTLAEVGMGKIAPDAIPYLIEQKDRRQCGLTAPPEGLFLKKVRY